jgi:pyruvate ferredoxin oxidoreductase gamma subunit
MLEIRWHGRGGQGAITVSKVLALAALRSGKYAQAFPEYGPERGGAPVKAYNRLDDQPIVIRSGVYEPHRVAVLDETLLDAEDVTGGLNPNGALVINTVRAPEEIRERTGYPGRILCVDADAIAEETGSEFANVPLLGALTSTLDFLHLETVEAALRESFSKMASKVLEKNVEALRRGYHEIVALEPQPKRKPAKARKQARGEERLPSFRELPIGGIVTQEIRWFPKTGGWRNQRPIFDEGLCVNCLLCWAHCPEPAIVTHERVMQGFDYDYCKGCGICAALCPTGAISMIPEAEAEAEAEVQAQAKGGVAA